MGIRTAAVVVLVAAVASTGLAEEEHSAVAGEVVASIVAVGVAVALAGVELEHPEAAAVAEEVADGTVVVRRAAGVAVVVEGGQWGAHLAAARCRNSKQHSGRPQSAVVMEHSDQPAERTAVDWKNGAGVEENPDPRKAGLADREHLVDPVAVAEVVEHRNTAVADVAGLGVEGNLAVALSSGSARMVAAAVARIGCRQTVGEHKDRCFQSRSFLLQMGRPERQTKCWGRDSKPDVPYWAGNRSQRGCTYSTSALQACGHSNERRLKASRGDPEVYRACSWSRHMSLPASGATFLCSHTTLEFAVPGEWFQEVGAEGVPPK